MSTNVPQWILNTVPDCSTEDWSPCDQGWIHVSSLAPAIRLGKNSVIGPRSHVGIGAKIGANTSIGALVTLGEGCGVGNSCVIRLGAKISRYSYIRDRVVIGKKAVIEQNVLVGEAARVGDRVSVTFGTNVAPGEIRLVPNCPAHVVGSHHAVTLYSPGMLAIGCTIKPFDYWLNHAEEFGTQCGYTPEQIEEYRGHIKKVISWENR